MLVFSFGVKSISGERTDFPFRSFVIAEFVVDIVVGAFRGLFSEAVNDCHLFGDELFGFCISGGGSEGEMGS